METTGRYLTTSAIPLAVTLVLWLTFMITSRIQKLRWGHAHTYIIIWFVQLIPGPIFYRLIFNTYTGMVHVWQSYEEAEAGGDQDEAKRIDERLKYLYEEVYSWENYVQGTSQLQSLVFVYLIWHFVIGIKRVEVQVKKNEQENTVNMFRKLKCASLYNNIFMGAVYIFQLAMLVYI